MTRQQQQRLRELAWKRQPLTPEEHRQFEILWEISKAQLVKRLLIKKTK